MATSLCKLFIVSQWALHCFLVLSFIVVSELGDVHDHHPQVTDLNRVQKHIFS